ncbi:hypothetical protein H6F61_27300 [Cyanobacteria bacterium FACHB-472]|nr:hypothetical protein [Cyanobacteria bacterium FACHB-472]
MSSFSNKPRILRGAFVEYGLSLPPLFVVFQFNPVQLTRNRSLSYSASSSRQRAGQKGSLRDFHKKDKYKDLAKLRDDQVVTVQEEVIGFEIRLDATDKLDEGDTITEQFGISPQLSTLELMVHPKDESLIGQALGSLLGSPGGFSFTRKPNPPLVLFIWGRKRVLPVNINSLNITEVLYSPDLNPIRATASINLTVIEGQSIPYMYSKAMKEAMSVLNLANLTDIANVVIPG